MILTSKLLGPLAALSHYRYLKACLTEKRFCYTNKVICSSSDNKNIVLQQQNV